MINYKRAQDEGERGKVWGRGVGRFFTQKVVGAWNALPMEVMEAGALPMFKVHLDRHMNKRRTEE